MTKDWLANQLTFPKRGSQRNTTNMPPKLRVLLEDWKAISQCDNVMTNLWMHNTARSTIPRENGKRFCESKFLYRKRLDVEVFTMGNGCLWKNLQSERD